MIVLSELQHDALTEIFNIGVGYAADVFSQMVNEEVSLTVPVVAVTSKQHAKDHLQQRESRPLCAIRQTYRGKVSTDAILMFPEENSLELVRLMVGGDFGLDQLTEMSQDAMAEIGNIMMNAIFSRLSATLDLTFEGSLPVVSVVTSESIFAVADALFGNSDQDAAVLILTIDFELSARKLSGYLVFLIDAPSSERLITSLGRFIQGEVK